MNKIKGIALLAVAVMTFGSCINEDSDNCRIQVGFQYTYNMLSADALSGQIDELKLYVFDNDGILVREYTMEDGAIQNPVSIQIDKLAAGRYSFAAWGRSNAISDVESDFEIPLMTVGQSQIGDLKYRLRTNAGLSDAELNHFLVGMKEVDIRRELGESVMIDMKKVTSKVRVIILPYSSGSNLRSDDYSFRIEDAIGNGVINNDFTVLADMSVTYEPYFTSIVTPAAGENPTASEIDRALAVEMSVSRLMESHEPRLKITHNITGAEVVNINLPWLFSLISMEEHRGWGLQEYLDRQDEYAVTLFFRDDTWMSATIIINGWVVNNINIGRLD